MEVTSQFLYRGTYTDFENTFQRRVESPVEVHLSSAKDVAVLRSKEWFHLNDSYDVDLLNKALTFRLSSSVCCRDRTAFSSVETMCSGPTVDPRMARLPFLNIHGWPGSPIDPAIS